MARRRAWLPIPPGLLLAACALLPAFHDGCAGDIAPYEVPAVLPPYVLGLVAAIWGIARVRGSRRRMYDGLLVAIGGSLYWLAVLGWPLLILSALSDDDRHVTWMLMIYLLVLAPLRPAMRGLARSRQLGWRGLRMLWLGAYASTLWFGLWTVPYWFIDSKSHPLPSMYLALAASLALAVAGYANERDREPRSRSPEAELPPSRVV